MHAATQDRKLSRQQHYAQRTRTPARDQREDRLSRLAERRPEQRT
jgi:hypothetical protein